MAITNPTKLSDFSGFLPPRQAAPIFERASRASVVQRLAQKVPLGASGEAIPVTTGRLTAGWVAEGARKPTSSGGLELVNMQPKKLAVIAVVSQEVVRANPGNYMQAIRNQVGDAFASAFDYAALYDLGGDGTGSGPFDTSIGATSKTVTIGTGDDIHADLVDGLRQLVNDGKRLTGFAIADTLEPDLLDARDGNGNLLYMDLSTGAGAIPEPGETRYGRLLNRPSFMGEGVSDNDADTPVVAVGGDWSQVAWGVIGGINYAVTDLAAVTIGGELVSLFEHNLVAIRAEAEYGVVVADEEAFVKYLRADATP